MKCPVCKEVDLAMADRQGVEIDYCPNCRGVWLDRGELDKIIERTSASLESTEKHPPQNRNRYSEGFRENRHHDDEHYQKKKKRGILGEIFDF